MQNVGVDMSGSILGAAEGVCPFGTGGHKIDRRLRNLRGRGGGGLPALRIYRMTTHSFLRRPPILIAREYSL